MLNSLLRKWKLTGLLQGLSEEQQKAACIFFEEVTKEMIKQEQESNLNTKTVFTLLPVARKLIETNSSVDASWLVNNHNDWVTRNQSKSEQEIVDEYISHISKFN